MLIVFNRAVSVVAMLVFAQAMLAAESPIADAAEKSDRAAIRTLLKQRADVNAPQADGMTALHWAAYRDDFEVAKTLVETHSTSSGQAAARVTATNRYGVTP